MRVFGSRNRTPGSLIAIVVLTMCGDAASIPPRIPADAVPVATTRAHHIDASRVAGDAVDPERLRDLLEDAGFQGGTERVGSDRPHGLDRVAVRALAFDGADGAERYLGWVRAHVDEILGAAESTELLRVDGVGDVPVFRHIPGDCCPKASVAYLAAWRDGPIVITLEMAGPAVTPTVLDDAADAVRLDRP